MLWYRLDKYMQTDNGCACYQINIPLKNVYILRKDFRKISMTNMTLAHWLLGLLPASFSAGWILPEKRTGLSDLNHPFCMIFDFMISVFRMYAPGIATNDIMVSNKPMMMIMATLSPNVKRVMRRTPVINSINQVTTLNWILTVSVCLRLRFALSLSNSLTPLSCSTL